MTKHPVNDIQQAMKPRRNEAQEEEKDWSGLPFSSPGDLLDAGIEVIFPELAGGFFTAEPPGKSGQSHSHTQFIHSFIILVARMSHIFSCFGWLYINIWSK